MGVEAFVIGLSQISSFLFHFILSHLHFVIQFAICVYICHVHHCLSCMSVIYFLNLSLCMPVIAVLDYVIYCNVKYKITDALSLWHQQ